MTTPALARLTAALLLTGALTASPTAASATSGAPAPSCDSAVGARTPVVLVHGFNANDSSWNDATRALLATPSSRFCTTAFNYGPVSTQWVTDQDIGGALAARILSLANASQRAGGTGKVIVVAHSMGGLAIRCAASTACGGSDQLSRVLGEVITFDTPNLGTYWKGKGASNAEHLIADTLSAGCHVADPFRIVPLLKSLCDEVRALGTSEAAAAFTPGSDQLNRLPALPKTVPVVAVAGSVKLTTSFWGHLTNVLGDAGDLVVNADSAFATANRVGALGGKVIRDCGAFNLDSDAPITLAAQPALLCWHVSETNNADWLVLVLRQLRKFDEQNASRAPQQGALDESVRQSVGDLENVDLPAGVCRPDSTAAHVRKGSALISAPSAMKDWGVTPDFLLSIQGTHNKAFGDLNHDGVLDLAFPVTCAGYGGGNNHFSTVVILTWRSGHLSVLADLEPGGHGKKAQSEYVAINNGLLVSHDLVQQDTDPDCCFTGHGLTRWRWTGTKFAEQ